MQIAMSTAFEQISVSEADRIEQAIMAGLMRELRETKWHSHQPVILRAEVQVEDLDALSWLCAQHPTSRGYWSDRENCFELAGVGRADVITANSGVDYHMLMGMLHDRITAARGGVRYFGGLRFSMDGLREDAWGHFKAYRFILPRFEVITRGNMTTFACNMLTSEDLKTVEAEFSALSFSERDSDLRLPEPVARHDHPDLEGWRANVEAALDSFEPGKYEKVVLSRKATFEFNESLNAAVLLRSLKGNTSQCFHFCFQPAPGAAFVGASPERLYRRDGDLIWTEAIAGSRPRGVSPEEDQAFSRELSSSEKDLREHQYVIHGIHETLTRLCSLVEAGKNPGILKLTRCQHLITTFSGQLRDGVKDADLLENLHPTAAVGGYPTDRALEDISLMEPFDRGWYAGPVGWIAKDAAQFVLGIRSGLIEGPRLHLFSGAGIVDGSAPEGEWDEIENKISDFVAVLTLT